MITHAIPSADEMFAAFLERDSAYDGIFVTAVRTTGIFCRPSCAARKPARENVEFFATTRQALFAGYRACKRCRPLEPPGRTPQEIASLLAELEAQAAPRLRDTDLRSRGLDPARVRRWFKEHHGMTFHAYQRGRRLGHALSRLGDGDDVTRTAFASGYESISGFQDALRQLTGRTPTASRTATVVRLTRIETPLGPMLAAATDAGLCLLEFTERRMLETQLHSIERHLDPVFVPGDNAVLEQTRQQLDAYFAGTLTEFSIPLLLLGTDFQRRVWDGLRSIPYGQTRSYGDQARALGAVAAVRAVARANGDNPIAIVVPCHRVIGSDGSLTGYGGGLWRKQRLLELEQGQLRLTAG
ncbi:MAG: bifunctional transcriptional activator/DNA repair enzyme AdaA [Longimicrobiales bacterium]